MPIKRFKVLDAFRGLAAIVVFLYHLPNTTALTSNPFISHAGVFVDLFFILSGFVMYHNYSQQIYTALQLKHFLKKRLLRLLPLHYFVLLVMLCFEIIKYLTASVLPFNTSAFEQNTGFDFVVQLLLLNATPLIQGFNWNFPSWSVSAELISYVVFGSLLLVFQRKKQLFTIMSVSIVCFGFLFFYGHYNTFNVKIDYGFSFIRGCIGFFFGVLLYSIKTFSGITFQVISKGLATFIEALSLLLVIYTISNLPNVINYFFLLHVVFGILILVFSEEKGYLSKSLITSKYQKLGLWSYSIYLNHALCISIYRIIIRQFSLDETALLLSECILIGCVIYVSKLTYQYIESPFYHSKIGVKPS